MSGDRADREADRHYGHSRDGADYKAGDGFNLLASTDEWMSPIFADVGPDGAVWVIDFYSFVI